jgi:hypothetical protein
MAESEVPDSRLGTTTAIAILEPAAGSMPVPATVVAAGAARGAALPRFLHRQHPQPEHPGRLWRRAARFFAWLDRHGIGELGAVRTHHVSTYIETLTGRRRPVARCDGASGKDARRYRRCRASSARRVGRGVQKGP